MGVGMTEQYQIVFMTAANIDEAQTIAEALVNESLAACVNMVESCRSVYRWKGELVRDDEVLMIVKTERGKFADIEKRVTALHSYDVPEIIAINLESIALRYRDFLRDLVGP